MGSVAMRVNIDVHQAMIRTKGIVNRKNPSPGDVRMMEGGARMMLILMVPFLWEEISALENLCV